MTAGVLSGAGGGLAEAGVGAVLGLESRPEPGEVGGDRRRVGVREIAGELLHDRVLAATLLVLIDGPHQVILMLAGEGGVDGRDRNPVRAMAGGAQARRGRRAAGFDTARGQGLAGEVGGDVLDVLV